MINPEQLERDLRPFTDPATDLDLLVGDGMLRIDYVRDGAQSSISISLPSQAVALKIFSETEAVEENFSSFASLLASKHFADIKSMAKNQHRMLSSSVAKTLIPPEGVLDDLPLTQNAFNDAARLDRTSAQDRPIKLILMDGPAGVGKTSLLLSTANNRAKDYGSDKDAPPILHVANRGRRFASLDELMALSIQIIRSKFTYDQVPALVRNGVLQIAIDGFDELVDADGYADAWSVLRDFLSELQYGGPLILSGRDTFFDLSGFRNKLGEVAGAVDIRHVRLAPTSPSVAREWLIEAGWSGEDLESVEAKELLTPNSYALRPYFLNEISKLGDVWSILNELTNPRDFLVQKFMNREAELITSRIPLNKEKAFELLYELFELISLEMAEGESEAVDIPFLQLAVDVVFGKEIKSPVDLAKLRHKAGSFALMENDLRSNFRKFPHTEISNHFLSIALIKQLMAGELSRFLKRGFVGSDLIGVFAEQVIVWSEHDLISLQRTLLRGVRTDVGFERLSSNCASLLLSTLVTHAPCFSRSFADMDCGEGVLFGALSSSRLERVTIGRLDARGADMSEVEFVSSNIGLLVIDNTTRFGSSIPNVSSVMIANLLGVQTLYDPREIRELLSGISKGRQLGNNHNHEAVNILNRACRVFLRQFYIKKGISDHASAVMDGPIWNQIENILLDHNRLKIVDRKDVSGRPGEFVHIIDARSLLARANDEDARIWDEISSISDNS
ncbi:hypothetical protein MKK67_04435 [Methylobacterium sp. J-072]|uniref:hypothetical protein n=1 Tax=Methylobacterium sp. J-072 TaxID=2836651 RepID=UPI001FBB2290|nr:hypothetical protein [Methylobacterium sp. J-072]MCJ2091757.1 hypothetical protein [Methylobacterium sp. J-072]